MPQPRYRLQALILLWNLVLLILENTMRNVGWVMSGTEFAFGFVEDVKGETSVAGILSLFSETIGQCGFTAYMIFDLPQSAESLDHTVLAFGAPEAWFQRYVTNDYVVDDPVVGRARQCADPFFWNDIADGDAVSEKGRRILTEAADHGLFDGYAVPVFDAFARPSVVSMAGPNLIMSEREKGALHLIAIYVHARLREVLEDQRTRAFSVGLSPREMECLRWTAAGKSSRDIGEILELSVHTVDSYLNSLNKKLDASNRAHAVAEAFRRGVLN